MKFKALLFLFCFSFSCYGNTPSSDGKIYIQPAQIQVAEDALYVELEGSYYPVCEISQDENGYFIPCVGYWWVCKNGHVNPPWMTYCIICKAQRGA